jgi:sodium transport system permease protein
VNWRVIRTVVGKELRETLRDRRTLIIMVVVPVLLYPLMLVLIEQIALFGRRTLEADAVQVAVVGAAPDAFRFIDGHPDIRAIQADAPPMRDLRAGAVDAVLVFPPGEWSETGTNRLELHYDGARERSGYARGLLQRRLGEWAGMMTAERLRVQGLPDSFAEPLAVDEASIATAQDVGGYMLGRFLPLILILMTVLGAFYPSIDLAAGEKERGTLEALLTAPVPADHLVLGKFITAALMGLTAATLNLASMLLTFQSGLVGFGDTVDIQFQLPARSALLIFAVLALLAVLFSALFLGIAVRSHSFKEAQNSLTPVYILSLVPAMLPMMPGTVFTTGFALMPVAGVGFLFRELMSGTAPPGPSVIAIAATAFYAALALVFAARAFGREDVLFGTGAASAEGSGGWWRRRPAGGAVPGPGTALGLAAAAALLFFYFGRPLALRLGEGGIMLSQWLFLAAPALLLVLRGRYDARRTLALRRPTGRAVAAALLIGAGGMPIGILIGWLQGFVIELPMEFLEAMRQFMTADSPGRVLWLLLVVAVTPAICEELVFRGVLLHSFASRMPAWGAIAASALVFGAFHLSTETVIRFLPTLWLGLLFGYVAWHSRSIVTSMLMHLVNNGAVVLLLASPALQARFGDGAPPWPALALAPLLLLAGLRLLPRRRSAAETDAADTDAAPG